MTNFAGPTKSPIYFNSLSLPLSLCRVRTSDPTRSACRPGGSFAVLAARKLSVWNCRRIEVFSGANQSRGFSASNSANFSWRCCSKNYDIATIGNLCVDIVLNVPELPPASPPERKAFMEKLAASPPDQKFWEAGGNCNTAIAAARLGLDCVAIGHVGDEIYGQFLLDVLHDEGIHMVGLNDEPRGGVNCFDDDYETLLCWVLVDPFQRHGFCSRADFSEKPAFSWMSSLTREIKMTIQRSKVLVVNGYGFDELSPGVIVSALNYAASVSTLVFFDPGPRGKSLSAGTPEQKMALSEFLRMSDVLLLTSNEAESLTGIKDPILAGKHLLKQGVRTKCVAIKMGSRGSILITLSSITCAPAFKVNVIDTVGCGDSFVAAIAYGFVHQMPMTHTLTFANAVGAATAMGCGAGRNVATLEQVENLLKMGELDEDESFWKEVLNGSSNDQEVTLLSKESRNGVENSLNHLSVVEVIPEVIGKLDGLPQLV